MNSQRVCIELRIKSSKELEVKRTQVDLVIFRSSGEVISGCNSTRLALIAKENKLRKLNAHNVSYKGITKVVMANRFKPLQRLSGEVEIDLKFIANAPLSV